MELVTAYLEGALPAPQRERFEAHLERCHGCRAYLGQMRLTISLTGRLPAEATAAAPLERLLDAFRTWKSPPEAGAGPADQAGR